MDKKLCRDIAVEIEKALAPVAKKFGLVVQMRGGKYDATGYYPKVELKEGDAGRKNFEAHAASFDLLPSDFGKEFQHKGEPFTVADVKLGSDKFPILAKRVSDGKIYGFPSETIARRLHPEVKLPVCPDCRLPVGTRHIESGSFWCRSCSNFWNLDGTKKDFTASK